MKKHFPLAAVFFAIFVGVVFCSAITFCVFFVAGMKSDKAAQIGDAFGVVNAFLNAFAFAGVLWTLNLQRDQSEKAEVHDKETKEIASITALLAALPVMIQSEKTFLAQLDVKNVDFENLTQLRRAIATVESNHDQAKKAVHTLTAHGQGQWQGKIEAAQEEVNLCEAYLDSARRLENYLGALDACYRKLSRGGVLM